MHINIRTVANGNHNVRIDRKPVVRFSFDGGTQLDGERLEREQRVAVAGAVAAHKGLCWSRGKCQGHDVTVG